MEVAVSDKNGMFFCKKIRGTSLLPDYAHLFFFAALMLYKGTHCTPLVLFFVYQ